MVFFTTPELLEIGDIPMTSLNEKPVRGEALKYYRRVADHYQLDIRQYQHVERISGDDGAFVTHATDMHGCAQQYGSKKVILSTGYYDVPESAERSGRGAAQSDPLLQGAASLLQSRRLVVGAKNSAAIAALELHWSGARVTLVHRGDGISSRTSNIGSSRISKIGSRTARSPRTFVRRVVEIREDSVSDRDAGGREAAEERLCLRDDRL